MNMNNIGVDYAPPTPAPVQHIIGEEDDMPAGANKPLTPAQALYGHHPSMGMHRPNSIPMRKPNAGTMPGPPSNRQRYIIVNFWIFHTVFYCYLLFLQITG